MSEKNKTKRKITAFLIFLLMGVFEYGLFSTFPADARTNPFWWIASLFAGTALICLFILFEREETQAT